MSKVYSFLILFFVLVGSIFWATQLPKITFDYDIEKFFPIDSEETYFFERFREDFGSDNDFILLAIKPTNGIFNTPFLAKLEDLTKELEKVSQVVQVISLSNVKEYKYFPTFRKPLELPYLHLHAPEKYLEDSLRIYSSHHLPGFLVSEDRSSLLIYIENTPYLDAAACQTLQHEIQEKIKKYELGQVYLSGKCLGQSTFINTIQKEIKNFTAASILLIACILFSVFRKLSLTLLPLLVVGLTVLWTLGIMIVLGRPVNMISNIIPSMLLIIGVSDVIHLISQYLKHQQQGMNSQKALKKAIKKVGIATILTSITTILGFLSLFSTKFTLLRELGLFASLGVLLALLMTYALVPPVLRYLAQVKGTRLSQGGSKWEDFWDKKLLLLFEWVDQHKKMLIAFSLVLMLICAALATFLHVNIFLLTDIRKDHPIRKDFAYISDHFGGSRPQAIQVTVKDSSLNIFSPEVLAELQQVESYLLTQYGFKKIQSPLSQIKAANQVFHSGSPTFYKVPDSTVLLQYLSQQFVGQLNINTQRKLVSDDQKSACMVGLLPDWGSSLVFQKNKSFYNFLKNEVSSAHCSYRITGTAHLMEMNTEFLAQDILWGLFYALAGISFFMGFILKSIRGIFIALLPNILPLLCLAAIMALLGISIRISTAIIFLIALGICVDDSIHFLSHFRQERKQQDVYHAVKNSFLQTGKAIVLTSLILSAGFLVLCTSSFLGTFYIGALVALSMILALLADLLFLPALLLVFMKD